MALQGGRDELGLLEVEAGVAAASAEEDAPAPWHFGKRAAVLLTVALASAAAVAAVACRGGATQGAKITVPAGAHAEKLWSNSGEMYRYHDPGYTVHHVGSQGSYVTTPAYEGDVNQVVYETAPAPTHVYHSDAHFVTEVHHDSMPVYHGDAYHGSYHSGGGGYHQSGYPGYHYHTYYHHRILAWWQGAGLWWAILFGILLVFSLLGCYYYFGRSRGPVMMPAPPPPPEERTRMCS